MHSEPDLFLGERISHARQSMGIDQQQLAELVGVKESTIAKWEADRSSPRANRINQLAGVLGVPVAWLLAGEDSASNEEHPSLNETAMVEHKLDAAEALLEQLGGILQDLRQQTKNIQREFDDEIG